MSLLSSSLSRRLATVKKVAPLVVLPIIFLGCGIRSDLNNSPSNQSQNLTAPSPVKTTDSSQQSSEEANAIRLVGASVESNKLDITSNDLRAKKNPKGDGFFVYVPQTRYSGVERHMIWMVIDPKAFALNGPSKMVTPSLPWPREGDDATWNKTGINKFTGASEAVEILFGS